MAYKRAVLNCIKYLANFGYTEEQVTPVRTLLQSENNYFSELCGGSEAGSYLKLIDCGITQLQVRE